MSLKLTINSDKTFTLKGSLCELHSSKTGKSEICIESGGCVKTGAKLPGTNREVTVNLSGWVTKE